LIGEVNFGDFGQELEGPEC